MITATLDGVWAPVWQDFELDNAQAVRRGYVNDVGKAAPHGTYAPIQCLRVQSTDDGDVENAIIDVYDGNACFCRFRWDETSDRWNSSTEELTFTLPAGTYPSGGNDKPFTLPELTLVRHPTVTIAKYTEDDSPNPVFIGKYHTTSLGDPSKGVDLPTQSLEFDGDDKTLTWKIQPWTSSDPVLVLRLGLLPLDPQRTLSGHNLNQKFGQVFVTQGQLDQVSSSFCGYNPASGGGYTADGPADGLYAATRTGTTIQGYPQDNPGQGFNGGLLFAFPRYDSYDYVQCTYIGGSPNIPVGIWPEALDVEEAETHSELVSSTTDKAQAYSVSLGLSAGLDKILSVSGSLEYSGQTETQKKNESRFTVSRKIAKVWGAHLDPTILLLHNTYIAGIRSKTLHLLSDTTPDKSQTVPWDADFVPSYGTHYANTITHGTVDIAETWFTLQNEMTAQKSGVKFSEEATATLDAFNADAKSSLSQEWSSKTGLEVSEEDTFNTTVGTPDPVGIILDLRPTSELMSPIFVPYDPKDDWGKFAPWVWTTVRGNFEDWLTEQGLNQPIDSDLVVDYTPRRFNISIPSVYVDGRWEATEFERPSGNLTASGSISLSAVPLPQNGAPATTIDPSQSILFGARGDPFSDVNVHPERFQPDSVCSIVTTAGNVNAGPNGGLCLELAFDITVTEVVSEWQEGTIYSKGTWTDVPVTRAHFQNSGMRVDLPFATVPHGQAQAPTTTVSVPLQGYTLYTLQITVAATDAGPFPSDLPAGENHADVPVMSSGRPID